MRAILTNWINILGVFLAVIFYAFFAAMFDKDLSYSFMQSAFSALILVCYGMAFWALFVLSLVILDLLLIVKAKKLITMLLVEWLIISLPFTYWIIVYKQWIFLVAVFAFLITQVLRNRFILRIK